MREEKKEVFINLAGQQSMFVGNLIQQAMNSYLAGDINSWYWKLNGIREMIHHDLKPDEVTELDDIEKEMGPIQNCWKKVFRLQANGLKSERKDVIKSNEFPKKVRGYQRKLMLILKRQGYFPNKENRKKISF